MNVGYKYSRCFGFGYGYGDGFGFGFGYGDGFGFGYGDSFGDGSGYGDGYDDRSTTIEQWLGDDGERVVDEEDVCDTVRVFVRAWLESVRRTGLRNLNPVKRIPRQSSRR